MTSSTKQVAPTLQFRRSKDCSMNLNPISMVPSFAYRAAKGTRLWSNIPILKNQLTDKRGFFSEFRRNNQAYKDRQKSDFDRHHGARSFLPIPPDTDGLD